MYNNLFEGFAICPGPFNNLFENFAIRPGPHTIICLRFLLFVQGHIGRGRIGDACDAPIGQTPSQLFDREKKNLLFINNVELWL